VQTISQEGDEDVRLDARFDLVLDRAQVQIVLHGLEGGLDLDQLDIELPQLTRVFPTQIAAQEITSFAPAHLAQLLAIERKAEGRSLGSHFDIDQTPSFMSSSSRSSSMAAICLRRAHSHLSLRRRMARSL